MPGCGFHVRKKLVGIAPIGVLCERVVCPCKALNKNYQSCLCKRNCMIKDKDHKFGPGCMVYLRYPSNATKPYSMYVKLGNFGCNNTSQTLWSSPYMNCTDDNNKLNLRCGPNNALEHDSTMNGRFLTRKKRQRLRPMCAKVPSQRTCTTCKSLVKVRKKDKCNGLTLLASTSRRMYPRRKSCKLQSPCPMLQRACSTKKRNERRCQACDPCTSCKEPNPKKKPTFLRNNDGPTAEQLHAWQEARAKAKCKSEGHRDLDVWGSGPILPPPKKGVKCSRGIHQKKKNMSKDCQKRHDYCVSNPCMFDNNDLYLPDQKRIPMAMPDSNYLLKSKLRSRSTSPFQFQFQSTHAINNGNLCLRCETSLYPSFIEVKTQNSLKCQSQSHRRRSRSPILYGSQSNSPTQPNIQCKSPSRSIQFWHRPPHSPSLVYSDETPQTQCKSPTRSSPIRPRSPSSPYSMYIDDTPQACQAQCRIPSRSCQIWPTSPPSPSSMYIDEIAQCTSPTRSCQSRPKSPHSPSSMYIEDIPRAQCQSPSTSCQSQPKSPPSPSLVHIDETRQAQCQSPTRSCQSRPKSPSSPSSMYIDEIPRARCNLYIPCKDCHCHKSEGNLNSCRYTKPCFRDTLCRYCPCHQKSPNLLSMSGTSSNCKPHRPPLLNCSMKARSHNWDKVTHYTIYGTKTSFEVSRKVNPKTQVYIVESPPCSPSSLSIDKSQFQSPKFKSIVESSDLPNQRYHDCDRHEQDKGFMTTTYLKNLPCKPCEDCACHDQNNVLTTILHKDHLPNQQCWEQNNNMSFTSYSEDFPSQMCHDYDFHKHNNNLDFLAEWNYGQSCDSKRRFNPNSGSHPQNLNHVIHSGIPPLEQPFVEEIILPVQWRDCKLHHSFVVTSCDVVPPVRRGHPKKHITYNPHISPMCALSATRESTGTPNKSPRRIKTKDCPSLQCMYPTPQCMHCECHKSLHTSSTPPKYSMHELSLLLPSQGTHKSQPHSLGHRANSGKHTQVGSPTQPIATCRKSNAHVSSQCCNPSPLCAYCHCYKGRAWQDATPKKMRSWSHNSSTPPSEYESQMRGLQSRPRDLEHKCSPISYSYRTPIPHNCCCGMCKSDGAPPFSNAMTCPNCNLTHSCCCGTCLCPNPCCSCSPIYSSSSYSIFPTHQEVAFKLAPKSPPRPRQISSPKNQRKDIHNHLWVCPNSQACCSRQDSATNGLFSMMSQYACSRSTSPSCLTHNSMQPQSRTYNYGESSPFSRAQWSPMSASTNCCCQRCLNGEPCSSRR